jgi:hypothetical protein
MVRSPSSKRLRLNGDYIDHIVEDIEQFTSLVPSSAQTDCDNGQEADSLLTTIQVDSSSAREEDAIDADWDNVLWSMIASDLFEGQLSTSPFQEFDQEPVLDNIAEHFLQPTLPASSMEPAISRGLESTVEVPRALLVESSTQTDVCVLTTPRDELVATNDVGIQTDFQFYISPFPRW